MSAKSEKERRKALSRAGLAQAEQSHNALQHPADQVNLRLLEQQDWEAFVAGWDRRLLEGLRQVGDNQQSPLQDSVARNIVANGSIRRAGAAEQSLLDAERSAGKALPNSVKSFWRCSNGLSLPLHSSLVACERFQRLGDLDAALCNILQPDAGARNVLAHPNEIAEVLGMLGRSDVSPQQLATLLIEPEVPDDVYFTYGQRQDGLVFRGRYASDCVVINEAPEFGSGGDGWAVLNPHVIFEDGEWEVWQVNTWGHRRHRSFSDFLRCLYTWSVKQLENLSAAIGPRPKLPA